MQINDCSHFSPAIVPRDCASWANSTSGYISIHWKSDRWCQVCHPLWPNDDIPNRRIQIEANSSRNVKVFDPLGRFTIKFHPILPLSSSILPSFSVFTRKDSRLRFRAKQANTLNLDFYRLSRLYRSAVRNCLRKGESVKSYYPNQPVIQIISARILINQIPTNNESNWDVQRIVES